jgi:hypothetical protein
MADLAYRIVYATNRVEARIHLVYTYQETASLSETARRWRTSRHVVRKMPGCPAAWASWLRLLDLNQALRPIIARLRTK